MFDDIRVTVDAEANKFALQFYTFLESIIAIQRGKEDLLLGAALFVQNWNDEYRTDYVLKVATSKVDTSKGYPEIQIKLYVEL